MPQVISPLVEARRQAHKQGREESKRLLDEVAGLNRELESSEAKYAKLKTNQLNTIKKLFRYVDYIEPLDVIDAIHSDHVGIVRFLLENYPSCAYLT